MRARVVIERIEGRLIGFIVTFDDVTDLLSAQRKAAWSDIARRIAHEIKNPLTPSNLHQTDCGKIQTKSAADSERFEEYVDIISDKLTILAAWLMNFQHLRVCRNRDGAGVAL